MQHEWTYINLTGYKHRGFQLREPLLWKLLPITLPFRFQSVFLRGVTALSVSPGSWLKGSKPELSVCVVHKKVRGTLLPPPFSFLVNLSGWQLTKLCFKYTILWYTICILYCGHHPSSFHHQASPPDPPLPPPTPFSSGNHHTFSVSARLFVCFAHFLFVCFVFNLPASSHSLDWLCFLPRENPRPRQSPHWEKESEPTGHQLPRPFTALREGPDPPPPRDWRHWDSREV